MPTQNLELPKFIQTMIIKNNATLGGNNEAIPRTEDYDDGYFLLKILKETFSEASKVKNIDFIHNLGIDEIKHMVELLTTQCQKIEAPLRPQLEKLCQNIIVTIFEIPDGVVNFTCELKDKLDDNVDVNITPESNDKIKYEFNDLRDIRTANKEVLKRRVIDSLIQGGSYDLSSYETYEKDIEDISDDLAVGYSMLRLLNTYLLFLEEKKINENKPLEKAFVHL